MTDGGWDVVQLTYTESATSNLGPFTVEAKLSSVGGAVTYAVGSGRVCLGIEFPCCALSLLGDWST